jgi:diguanylate cyclase (GGDEF)-like protein
MHGSRAGVARHRPVALQEVRSAAEVQATALRPARRAHDAPAPFDFMNAFAAFVARTRATFALPDMSEQERVAFRKSQGEVRDPLVVPVVVAAALLIAGFVGWDMMRDPGHLGGPVARVRLGGGAAVLLLLAAVRHLPGLSFRVQALVMYCAIYAMQLAIGVALGADSPLQLPGLLIVMFFGVIALPRAGDSLVNVLLAAISVPLVLPRHPHQADVIYAVAHFANVVLLVWAASALLERLAAQSFAYRGRLQREASTDALTGLHNRREFESGMVREMERARRMHVPLSLAILDIDFFKRINDQHGHDVGDAVLRAVAATLQRHIRKSDLLARIGGEEFALVMLGTQPPGAWVVLERLRNAVAGLRIPAGGQDIGCTISIGITDRVDGDRDWPALYKRADTALYEAKEGGRNRVVEAPPPEPVPA